MTTKPVKRFSDDRHALCTIHVRSAERLPKTQLKAAPQNRHARRPDFPFKAKKENIMLSSESAPAVNDSQPGFQRGASSGQPQISIQGRAAATDPGFTMELLELELSVDGFSTGREGFSAHVAAAASAIGGTLLFELPASGLIENCERIAALRIPREGSNEAATVFACLEAGGATIRMENPS